MISGGRRKLFFTLRSGEQQAKMNVTINHHPLGPFGMPVSPNMT